jgi:hypothetical protein
MASAHCHICHICIPLFTNLVPMKQFTPTRIFGVILLVASSIGLVAGKAQAIGFTPAPGSGAPSQATGGASRGGFFKPPTDQGTPQQASGGASRGRFFTPAKGKGVPQRASGGASRVGRYDLNQPSDNPTASSGPAALVAMLPQSFNGTTIAAHPTIMVYVPASTAKTAVFSLKDDTGNMVYQQQLDVSGKAGLVAIALPANAPALAVNQNYQWYMALQVDGELNPSTPYVDGWIQRVAAVPAVATAMQQPNVLEQAEVLGANGVWYDCVAKLAGLRARQPASPELDKHWAELLESVGLQDVTPVPLISAMPQ